MARDDSTWHGKPEPDISVVEKIVREHLRFAKSDSFKADLTSSSNYGKLYDIHKNEVAVSYMRVVAGQLPMPVQNEVSNIHWLQQNTTLGLGSIFSSDGFKENEHGHGWKLEQCSDGKLLGRDLWQKLTWSAKENFVQHLARGHAQLLEPRNRFEALGQLYFGFNPASGLKPLDVSSQHKTNVNSFYVGAPSSEESLTGDADTKSPRGPYYKSSDWLFERLNGIIKDNSATVAVTSSMDPEYDLQPANLTISLAKRLRAKVSEFFFPESDSVIQTVLWNPWIPEDMLMMTKEGDIKEIFGFRHSQTVPVWRCYELPEVLLGSNQDFAPAIGASDYWYHLLNFEKTKLRSLYLKTLENLHPGFKLSMKQYQRLIDFSYAVVQCQVEESAQVIQDWLNSWDLGIYVSSPSPRTPLCY
jgi:hypothetical protein